MRCFVLSFCFLFAVNVFAAPLNLTGTVKALDETGEPVENAVVLLKVNDGLLAYARTLSDENGNFTLSGKSVPGETPIARQQTVLPAKFASYQAMDLKGRSHSLNSLPQGIYVLLGKTENGRSVNLGTVYHKGGALKTGEIAQKEQKARTLARLQTAAGEVQLIVRKTGFLPEEVSINSFDENVGIVVLESDPLEDRIDSVLLLMSTSNKIYQMNQVLCTGPYCTFGTGGANNNGNLNGSVLHGGEAYYNTILKNAYDEMLKPAYRAKIPVTYGKDMMHGAAAISGATVFPHNIGMGATRDSTLVRQACEITAKESRAGNVDLIFGPAIPVPQNERWGRVYEGYGETAELAVQMGAACVRGYQGEKYNAEWRVIATAKHYLADGGTTDGEDRGNTQISDDSLRVLHLPGYEAVVEQGVLSVMASFSEIRGVNQHVDSLRLTKWLKTELGFDGYIIGDWGGITNSEGSGYDECNYGSCTINTPIDAVEKAVNAGLDMAMNESYFVTHLTNLVNSGKVKMDRIDDAVRRILRAKFRAGRMDNPNPQNWNSYPSSIIGSPAHRKIAREAVRKSLVLLKNENNALPIPKTTKVFVTGSHATNTCKQCGGWTLGWDNCSTDNIPGATSIKAGFNSVVNNSTVEAPGPNVVIVYVTGEDPYAEWGGDRELEELNFTDSQLANLRNSNPNAKIVVIFISGRAMVVKDLLSNSDAFVAAWLPGSEGAGIAEVLFRDKEEYNFTGKLPFTWPRTTSVIPVNSKEQSANWFPYGYGLSY